MFVFKRKKQEQSEIHMRNFDTSEIDVYITLARSVLGVRLPQFRFFDYIYTRDGVAVAANEEYASCMPESTAFLSGFYNQDHGVAHVALFHPKEHRALTQEEVLFSIVRLLRRVWQVHTCDKFGSEADRVEDMEAFALAFVANKTAFDMLMFERQVESENPAHLLQKAVCLAYIYF